jgi:hypothetical protein
MANTDIDKHYVSPYDRFFYEFDATHEKSASQVKEIKKYERIHRLRDTPTENSGSDSLLMDF